MLGPPSKGSRESPSGSKEPPSGSKEDPIGSKEFPKPTAGNQFYILQLPINRKAAVTHMNTYIYICIYTYANLYMYK